MNGIDLERLGLGMGLDTRQDQTIPDVSRDGATLSLPTFDPVRWRRRNDLALEGTGQRTDPGAIHGMASLAAIRRGDIAPGGRIGRQAWHIAVDTRPLDILHFDPSVEHGDFVVRQMALDLTEQTGHKRVSRPSCGWTRSKARGRASR